MNTTMNTTENTCSRKDWEREYSRTKEKARIGDWVTDTTMRKTRRAGQP